MNHLNCSLGFQVALVAKNPPANAGDTGDLGSIPGSGHGNPLQYACLETPMGRGAWRATVRRVAESDTTEATECACTHTRTHTHTHTTTVQGHQVYLQLYKQHRHPSLGLSHLPELKRCT